MSAAIFGFKDSYLNNAICSEMKTLALKMQNSQPPRCKRVPMFVIEL